MGCFGCFGLAVLFSCCAVAGVLGGPALWNQLFRSRAEELGIERVTVDYRDENGQCLVAITASQSAIDMLAEGEISREQFMREVSIGPGSLSFQEVLNLVQDSG